MLFHVRHNWWESGIKYTQSAPDLTFHSGIANSYKNYVQFQEKRILLLQEAIQNVQPTEKLKVDYIILSKSPKVKIKDLVAQYDFEQIIFDSSNSRWRTKYWKQDCSELNLPYYDVSEQGAFILNI